MATADRSPAETPVRLQYESFPYPYRDPADEKKRFVGTSTDNLATVQHYCFRGRKDFRQGFRALVAGGGTGDSVVHLAYQLRQTDAKIVYVDLSSASMDIAKQRLRYYNLEDKVTWIHDSLLNLPKLDLEPFDYINCIGVLHHLPDPDEGLAALRSVLKDDGALGLMVYGQYGRTGVYQMQEMMRLINSDEPDMHVKVQNTKTILQNLPDSNWLERQIHHFKKDIQQDVGIYDLLLHSQDRAYTVLQLYEFLSKAGLNLIEFNHTFRTMYDPMIVLQNTPLLEKIQHLDKPQQQAIAELYYGNISKHVFWASPQTNTIADPRDPECVPMFNHNAVRDENDSQFGGDLRQKILSIQEDHWRFELSYPDGIQIARRLSLDQRTRKLVELIDDRHTMGQIVQELAQLCETPPQIEDVWNFCVQVLEMFRGYDLVLLRHRSTPRIENRTVPPPQGIFKIKKSRT